GVGRGGGRDHLADLVGDDVLRDPVAGAADPAARVVRSGRPGGAVRWAGPARGLAFCAVLAALPGLGLAHWALNMLVFTLMYAIMASAWNLPGGFAGYPSLGHAAFFGFGAYAVTLY